LSHVISAILLLCNINFVAEEEKLKIVDDGAFKDFCTLIGIQEDVISSSFFLARQEIK